jgi:hypothetical protein
MKGEVEAMSTRVLVVSLVSLLLPAALVFAAPPIITSPTFGWTAGPSVVVRGTAEGADRVNVWTEVRDNANDQLIASVPGLQHDVSRDGSYSVKIAEPRVYFGPGTDLRYDVHVKSFLKGQELGESVVSLVSGSIASSSTCTPEEGQAPVLSGLKSGQCVGPNLDIVGMTRPHTLVTVWTEIFDPDNGQLVGSVPGIRHLSGSDGSFNVRIATPRVAFGYSPLRYEIHARTERNGQCSPDAILDVKYDQNTCSTWGAPLASAF